MNACQGLGNGGIPAEAMLETMGEARSPQGGDRGFRLGRPGDVVPGEPEAAVGGEYCLAQDSPISTAIYK